MRNAECSQFTAVQRGYRSNGRLYIVVFAENTLNFGLIDGNQAARTGVLACLGIFSILFAIPIELRAKRKREEKRQKYLSLDPLGEEFIQEDKRNFRIHLRQVHRIVLTKTRNHWWRHLVSNTAYIDLIRDDYSRVRLVLPRDQYVEPVENTLRQYFPKLRIE